MSKGSQADPLNQHGSTDATGMVMVLEPSLGSLSPK